MSLVSAGLLWKEKELLLRSKIILHYGLEPISKQIGSHENYLPFKNGEISAKNNPTNEMLRGIRNPFIELGLSLLQVIKYFFLSFINISFLYLHLLVQSC